MPTFQTTGGQLLRSSFTGSVFPTFPPMWSDGERWGPGGRLDDDRLVSYEAIYRSQPVVASVVDKLARRIASLPFDAYKQLDKGEREVVKGDALDALITKPLPGTSAVWLNHQIAQSLLVHGNALVAKLRAAEDEPPYGLFPLDWGFVSAFAPMGGRVEYWATHQFGDERVIDPADVMHFAWGAPSGQIGVSPLEKLGVTIRLENAMQRHQTAMFRNGSRPSMAVTVDMPNPKPDQLEYARSRVESMHKGVDNSGRTFFMGSNIKVQPLSMSPVEAALIDQRRLSREEVGMVYDLAGPLMNDLTHATYSNVTELLKGLYRDVIPPWLALIKGAYQSQLLDPEPTWMTDRFVDFDLTDKLTGDPKELADTLKIQVDAGIITRNEARRILNLPPADDDLADKLIVSALNQRAEAQATGEAPPQLPQAPATAAETGPPPAPATQQ